MHGSLIVHGRTFPYRASAVHGDSGADVEIKWKEGHEGDSGWLKYRN